MDSKLTSKPGVSTRSQNALARAEGATKPSTQANPPKRPTKAPRMETTSEAKAKDIDPRHSNVSRAKDVSERGGPSPGKDGPRQNPPHQLVPSVGSDNPPSQSSDHASGSQRTLGRHLRRDTGKSKVPVHRRHPDDESTHSNYGPRRRWDSINNTDNSKSYSRSGYDITSDGTPKGPLLGKTDRRGRENRS
ncbi:hypothetical protein LIER_12365 [Lithospermum erythrorhizon]|uniref:Uncharacterized protein n=1 Tax=Lithospermum erythrorhizon TaxID=34254 RepID=A0AAV3PTX9_LITER